MKSICITFILIFLLWPPKVILELSSFHHHAKKNKIRHLSEQKIPSIVRSTRHNSQSDDYKQIYNSAEYLLHEANNVDLPSAIGTDRAPFRIHKDKKSSGMSSMQNIDFTKYRSNGLLRGVITDDFTNEDKPAFIQTRRIKKSPIEPTWSIRRYGELSPKTLMNEYPLRYKMSKESRVLSRKFTPLTKFKKHINGEKVDSAWKQIFHSPIDFISKYNYPRDKNNHPKQISKSNFKSHSYGLSRDYSEKLPLLEILPQYYESSSAPYERVKTPLEEQHNWPTEYHVQLPSIHAQFQSDGAFSAPHPFSQNYQNKIQSEYTPSLSLLPANNMGNSMPNFYVQVPRKNIVNWQEKHTNANPLHVGTDKPNAYIRLPIYKFQNNQQIDNIKEPIVVTEIRNYEPYLQLHNNIPIPIQGFQNEQHSHILQQQQKNKYSSYRPKILYAYFPEVSQFLRQSQPLQPPINLSSLNRNPNKSIPELHPILSHSFCPLSPKYSCSVLPAIYFKRVHPETQTHNKIKLSSFMKQNGKKMKHATKPTSFGRVPHSIVNRSTYNTVFTIQNAKTRTPSFNKQPTSETRLVTTSTESDYNLSSPNLFNLMKNVTTLIEPSMNHTSQANVTLFYNATQNPRRISKRTTTANRVITAPSSCKKPITEVSLTTNAAYSNSNLVSFHSLTNNGTTLSEHNKTETSQTDVINSSTAAPLCNTTQMPERRSKSATTQYSKKQMTEIPLTTISMKSKLNLFYSIAYSLTNGVTIFAEQYINQTSQTEDTETLTKTSLPSVTQIPKRVYKRIKTQNNIRSSFNKKRIIHNTSLPTIPKEIHQIASSFLNSVTYIPTPVYNPLRNNVERYTDSNKTPTKHTTKMKEDENDFWVTEPFTYEDMKIVNLQTEAPNNTEMLNMLTNETGMNLEDAVFQKYPPERHKKRRI